MTYLMLDIIPLPMPWNTRILTVTTDELLTPGLPVAGLTLGAGPDERCDDCFISPDGDDPHLFDCSYAGTFCESCATRRYPSEMRLVLHKRKLELDKEKGD